MEANASLISHLDTTPVLGVSLAGVSLLRLDLYDCLAPGNKWFKLQGNIVGAQDLGIDTLVSFGGAWSNHLHALAATGRELGLQTVGIVRGEEPARPSAMLCDAARWGMKLVYVSRQEYRRRRESAYVDSLRQRFDPCLVIPEGGANAAGVDGCEAIAGLLEEVGFANSRVVLAVGTGTTLAGVARGLGAQSSAEVVGISVLKGAFDLDATVMDFAGEDCARWKILHNHHCGGYAKVSTELRDFMLAFESVHGIPLDPVYTGKAMFAIYQRVASGAWNASRPTVLVHTGGLQGRRGFGWLAGL